MGTQEAQLSRAPRTLDKPMPALRGLLPLGEGAGQVSAGRGPGRPGPLPPVSKPLKAWSHSSDSSQPLLGVQNFCQKPLLCLFFLWLLFKHLNNIFLSQKSFMLAGIKSPKQYTQWYIKERGTMSVPTHCPWAPCLALC